jgi:hypothetical protein
VIFSNRDGIYNIVDGGTTYAMLAKPFVCGCQRMAYFIINRLGSTRCVECDAEFKKKIEAGELGPQIKALIADPPESTVIELQLAAEAREAQAALDAYHGSTGSPSKITGRRYGSGWNTKIRSAA